MQFVPLKSVAARALVAVGLLASFGAAHANATADAFVDVTDSAAFDGFNQLVSSRINAANLVAGITSNVVGSSGDATLARTSGTAYPASGGLYEWGGPRSTFDLTVSDAVDGVTSVVFQSLISISDANGVYGLLSADNLPTLSYNGGTQSIAYTTLTTSAVSAGLGMDGLPLAADPDNQNYAYFVWDLSSVTTPIESFTLSFATDAHANSLAFQVDQVVAVPEPSTLALMALGLGGVAFAARRRERDSAAA